MVSTWWQSKRVRRAGVVGTALIALSVGGGAFALAGDEGGRETGPGADHAISAALVITEGGRANSVERDSEDGATWEVEVTRTDGATVDVRLDAAFGLVVVEDDREDVGEATSR